VWTAPDIYLDHIHIWITSWIAPDESQIHLLQLAGLHAELTKR